MTSWCGGSGVLLRGLGSFTFLRESSVFRKPCQLRIPFTLAVNSLSMVVVVLPSGLGKCPMAGGGDHSEESPATEATVCPNGSHMQHALEQAVGVGKPILPSMGKLGRN